MFHLLASSIQQIRVIRRVIRKTGKEYNCVYKYSTIHTYQIQVEMIVPAKCCDAPLTVGLAVL